MLQIVRNQRRLACGYRCTHTRRRLVVHSIVGLWGKWVKSLRQGRQPLEINLVGQTKISVFFSGALKYCKGLEFFFGTHPRHTSIYPPIDYTYTQRNRDHLIYLSFIDYFACLCNYYNDCYSSYKTFCWLIIYRWPTHYPSKNSETAVSPLLASPRHWAPFLTSRWQSVVMMVHLHSFGQ